MGVIGNCRDHGGWPRLNATGFRGRDADSVVIFPAFHFSGMGTWEGLCFEGRALSRSSLEELGK